MMEAHSQGLIIDMFAGGGGASTGIWAATGRHPNWALNHDPIAISVHRANHPSTHHRIADIRAVDPLSVTLGQLVWLLWASIDCTHFSCALGGKPRDEGKRSLGWEVVHWAKVTSPAVIIVENVVEFLTWGPLGKDGKPQKKEMGDEFRKWRKALIDLGYVVDYRVLVASHYGAPTSRKRLFIIARRDGLPIQWPAVTHGPGLQAFNTAASCVDFSIPCPSIFERKKALRPTTLRRIANGIERFVINCPDPFIVPEYGIAPTLIQAGYGERKGQSPRSLDLHQPLGTVVAQGRKHALVAAFLNKHYSGVVGVPFDGRPLDTVTATDHHSLAVACLATFRGTAKNQSKSAPLTAPLGTISAGGVHAAEVRAFLTAYYGADAGQSLAAPLRTIPTLDRFALVNIKGVDYQITDIGMRMLEPHELLAAQFGRYASDYDLSSAVTKKNKVRLIGNSVCPEVAEAVVAANIRRAA